MNCDPAQTMKSAKSRGSDNLIPKEITTKVSSCQLQHNNLSQKIFCRESAESIARIILQLFDHGSTNNAKVIWPWNFQSDDGIVYTEI